ncbi:MAG: hypothetical protein KF915_18565 [Polyangiaceae bacterium]|nr:hypothetical protein [Polyangiaceae bacterium]
MNDLQIALALGLMTSILGVLALRFPLAAWVALAPLGVAMSELSSGAAAASGAIAAVAIVAPSFPTKTLRPLLMLATVISAASWGAAAAGVARLWPDGEAGWSVLAMPLFAVVSVLPLRIAGAPRTATNPLARSQEQWLPVVHIARLGSDLFVTAAMGVSSGVVTALVLSWLRGVWSVGTIVAMATAGLLLIAILAFGLVSYRRAKLRTAELRTLRVAGVVCDGAPPKDEHDGFWPLHSSEYADVPRTIARYRDSVSAAVVAGARVVVLPEVAVRVSAASRDAWVRAACEWAAQHGVVIVTPYFDEEQPINELVIVGPSGVLARYEKQHGAPIEPKRRERMPPGHATTDEVSISTVICVDLDYGDLVPSVARRGGLLAVPANDWPGYETLHHRSAVWAAVMSGTSVLRATGHGITAAYDPAGHVIAQKSSLSERGPVVLVTDVPI